MGKGKDKKSVVPRKEQASAKAEARANPAPTRDTLHSNKQPKIIKNDLPASDDDDDGSHVGDGEELGFLKERIESSIQRDKNAVATKKSGAQPEAKAQQQPASNNKSKKVKDATVKQDQVTEKAPSKTAETSADEKPNKKAATAAGWPQ